MCISPYFRCGCRSDTYLVGPVTRRLGRFIKHAEGRANTLRCAWEPQDGGPVAIHHQQGVTSSLGQHHNIMTGNRLDFAIFDGKSSPVIRDICAYLGRH